MTSRWIKIWFWVIGLLAVGGFWVFEELSRCREAQEPREILGELRMQNPEAVQAIRDSWRKAYERGEMSEEQYRRKIAAHDEMIAKWREEGRLPPRENGER